MLHGVEGVETDPFSHTPYAQGSALKEDLGERRSAFSLSSTSLDQVSRDEDLSRRAHNLIGPKWVQAMPWIDAAPT